jgi:two-component system OmpR family response regulator
VAVPRVLVVEDEENLAFVLKASLQLTGFSVDDVRTGREALTLATSNGRLDLIVLDVMLPDLDGFEICRRLRLDRIDSPILFLTALDGLHERIRGLTLGGDDYLIKPFSVEELVARSRALIRRSGRELDQQALTCGPISMDEDAHRVTVRGKAVELSPTEYNLLRYFMSNKGVALTKTQILDHVWDYDFSGESTVVETFVSLLRRKLGIDGPNLIGTVRGVGYRLLVPEE